MTLLTGGVVASFIWLDAPCPLPEMPAAKKTGEETPANTTDPEQDAYQS